MRVAFVPLLGFLVFVTGCSVMTYAVPDEPSTSAGAAFRGTVHGGQQPINGAHVYLYAVNSTGYGGAGIAASTANASLSLLTAATGNPPDANGNYYVTTGADGSFAITGDYTCPASATPVYLYSAGGNPGFGTNSAAALLAGLGTCPAGGTLSSSLYITVNEVSTIATAYALAGFATDPLHISSAGTANAVTGITHASGAIATLENLSTGTANKILPSGTGTVPQSEIYTLADILSSCINSTGPGSTPCATLFSSTTNGSAQPSDTATAAIDIAHNPGANVGNLFALQTANGPFHPTLGSAPNDFTVAITNTSVGLNAPTGIVIDSNGNAWVANNGAATISKFNTNGSPTSNSPISGGGLNAPVFVAADVNSNIWATNGSGNLSYFSGAGQPYYPNGFGDLSDPIGMALDASTNAWVANSANSGIPSNSVSEFTDSAGELSSTAGYTGGGMNTCTAVAIDTSGYVWVVNHTGSLTRLNQYGVVQSGSPFTGGGLNQPGDIAIDGTGNLWVGNQGTSSLSKFTSTGAPITGSSGYTGGGLNVPYMIAVDGNGNVWTANNGPSNNGTTISEFSSSGTPITGANGYQGGLSGPWGIAIDASGNVWVTSAGNSSITKFVGAAAPVVTPIQANLLSPYGTHAVNRP